MLISAYPLFEITEIILAYVEGLPIPSSSSFFTKLASEYLGGGCVKCCSSLNSFISIIPLFTSGSILSSSLSSIFDSFKYPSNFITEPLALKIFFPSIEEIVIVFLSNFADSI